MNVFTSFWHIHDSLKTLNKSRQEINNAMFREAQLGLQAPVVDSKDIFKSY